MNDNASCDDNPAITNSEHNMTTPHRRPASGNHTSPLSSTSSPSPSILSSKINPFEITTSSSSSSYDDERQIATGVVNAIPTPPFNDDHDDDIDDDELERSVAGLLSRHNTNVANGNTPSDPNSGGPLRRPLCPPPFSCYKIGNTIVIFPRLYAKTGYGVVGPHWWGLLCTLGLIFSASAYFLRKSRDIGEGSFVACCFFTVGCCTSLFFVACGDPGVIAQRGGLPEDAGGRELRNWRWCDLCSVYQPPRAAHCPECNVCVAGYDHHCPWMGTCVGRKNMKAFVFFNLSWLFYLIFAIAWVTILGPKTIRHVG